MKAEFELSIDPNTGLPIIKFRHHDMDNSTEQLLLKIFVDKAKESGIKIGSPSGHRNSSKNESWDDYVIRVDKDSEQYKNGLVNATEQMIYYVKRQIDDLKKQKVAAGTPRQITQGGKLLALNKMLTKLKSKKQNFLNHDKSS